MEALETLGPRSGLSDPEFTLHDPRSGKVIE
jgi:hypothetical protein